MVLSRNILLLSFHIKGHFIEFVKVFKKYWFWKHSDKKFAYGSRKYFKEHIQTFQVYEIAKPHTNNEHKQHIGIPDVFYPKRKTPAVIFPLFICRANTIWCEAFSSRCVTSAKRISATRNIPYEAFRRGRGKVEGSEGTEEGNIKGDGFAWRKFENFPMSTENRVFLIWRSCCARLSVLAFSCREIKIGVLLGYCGRLNGNLFIFNAAICWNETI